MSLLIATTDGTTTFSDGQVQVDLISIALMDTGLGFAETTTTDIEGVTTYPVTYTQSEAGVTADRVDDLVNNTNGVPANPRIVIFGVDDSFVLSDGTPLKGNGVAIPVGVTGNPFTADVATFYDITLCGGQGIWVDAEGGGTTQMTTDVLLYHELSHCFHFVTGTTAPTSAEEEVAAEIDENDMRDVRGLTHRDVNSHNGGCGGGPVNCCIIASLATGSPYSEEINSFRHYREHTLRGSIVGDDFFERLYHSYYAFSPEVVRLMGRKPVLGDAVRSGYVVPLLGALELLIHYGKHRGAGVAGLLLDQSRRPDCRHAFGRTAVAGLVTQIDLVEAVVRHGALENVAVHAPSTAPQAPVEELADLIRSRIVEHELLQFALVDPLRIWARGMLEIHDGIRPEAVEEHVTSALAEWVGGLPIGEVWTSFSRLKAGDELVALDQFMFDRRARTTFGRRLAEQVPALAGVCTEWSAAEPEGGPDA